MNETTKMNWFYAYGNVRENKKIKSQMVSRKWKEKFQYENWLPIKARWMKYFVLITDYLYLSISIYSVIIAIVCQFSFFHILHTHKHTFLSSSIASFERLAAAAFICYVVCVAHKINMIYIYMPERWFLPSDKWKYISLSHRIPFKILLGKRLYTNTIQWMHTNFRTWSEWTFRIIQKCGRRTTCAHIENYITCTIHIHIHIDTFNVFSLLQFFIPIFSLMFFSNFTLLNHSKTNVNVTCTE